MTSLLENVVILHGENPDHGTTGEHLRAKKIKLRSLPDYKVSNQIIAEVARKDPRTPEGFAAILSDILAGKKNPRAKEWILWQVHIGLNTLDMDFLNWHDGLIAHIGIENPDGIGLSFVEPSWTPDKSPAVCECVMEKGFLDLQLIVDQDEHGRESFNIKLHHDA